MNNNFGTLLVNELSDFGDISDVIMRRLANSFYVILKVKTLVKVDAKITS